MGKFNRNEKSWGNKGGGHGGFKGGFGGRKFGGGGGGFSKGRMFSAVCSDCGEDCEVPFKPTGEKPVFCNRCFGDAGRSQAKPRNEFRPQRSFEDRPRPAGNEELKAQLDRLDAKLDRILKMLAPVVKPEEKSESVNEEKPVKAPVKKTAKKTAAKAKAKPAKKKK